MKQLKTLIKYHKSLLDDKRRVLKKLRDEEESIINMQAHLEQELAEQAAIVAEQADMAMTFGSYTKSNIARRKKLAEYLVETQHLIELAEAEVADAYRELKKYEITKERRAKEEKQELDRKEQADLDETARNLWRRGES